MDGFFSVFHLVMRCKNRLKQLRAHASCFRSLIFVAQKPLTIAGPSHCMPPVTCFQCLSCKSLCFYEVCLSCCLFYCPCFWRIIHVFEEEFLHLPWTSSSIYAASILSTQCLLLIHKIRLIYISLLS